MPNTQCGALTLASVHLTYAFDDYRPGAQNLGGTIVGNGNLWYTVSQDNQSGKHTVRWESLCH